VIELFNLYGARFVAKNRYGALRSAEMDFIEGENGVLYFMKIG
jgi:hypothetical protein